VSYFIRGIFIAFLLVLGLISTIVFTSMPAQSIFFIIPILLIMMGIFSLFSKAENRLKRQTDEQISVSYERVGPETSPGAAYFACKRFFDIVVSLQLLAILSPLLLLIACLIKYESSGPILFYTNVCGFDGRSFKRYRFRTKDVLNEQLDSARDLHNQSRITEIGWYLRQTGLDDAPELINVLRGDMSIVGPRPRFIDEYPQTTKYPFHNRIKPGIVGWAQIHGYRARLITDPDDMARIDEYDLWYVANRSILVDTRIIFSTFFGERRRTSEERIAVRKAK
jgi:lipopolysaccharide/colanic/teichoic acid biosynthesis glycosyltransferase